jgi:hypothetical protein
MTEQTRRNVLRYGIAIDLVILATGIGMLVPATAPLLITAYAVAVVLSVWRGGWQGGVTALVLSAVAMVAAFPDLARAPQVVTFIVIGGIAGAAVAVAKRPKSAPATDVDAAVTAPSAEEPPEDFAYQPLERETLAEVVQLRQEPIEPVAETPPPVAEAPAPIARGGKRKSRKRDDAARRAEEEAQARAAAEEVAHIREEAEAARQRADAERIEAERVAVERREEAERRAAEAELALRRAEAERAEAERLAAVQREEVERRAAEAEAARQRAEQERLRLERELEERIAQERANAERDAQRLAREREQTHRELRGSMRSASPPKRICGDSSRQSGRQCAHRLSARSPLSGSASRSRPSTARRRRRPLPHHHPHPHQHALWHCRRNQWPPRPHRLRFANLRSVRSSIP